MDNDGKSKVTNLDMELKESFRWQPEVSVYHEAENWAAPQGSRPGGRWYRGRAITATITKNDVRYAETELKDAASSLRVRPTNLDHRNKSRLARALPFPENQVVDANFEDQGVEYLAYVVDSGFHELYDAGHIKHTSIEARALNRTPGSRIANPVRIAFTELAFVTDAAPPPGDSATTVERLAETADMCEIPLKELMILGEPFAGYKNFDDCVAKNQDKEDPKGYCASVMRKVEGGETIMSKPTENPIVDTEEYLEDPIVEIIQEIEDAELDNPTLEEVRKWIQKIGLKKGALHRQLGIGADKKIPLGILQRAAKKAGKLGARARLALKFRTFRHCMESLTPEEILNMVRESLIDPVEEGADMSEALKTSTRRSIDADNKIREDLARVRQQLTSQDELTRKEVEAQKAEIKKFGELAAAKADLDALEARVREGISTDLGEAKKVFTELLTAVKTKFDEIITVEDTRKVAADKLYADELLKMGQLHETKLNETVAAENIRKAAIDKAYAEELAKINQLHEVQLKEAMKAKDEQLAQVAQLHTAQLSEITKVKDEQMNLQGAKMKELKEQLEQSAAEWKQVVDGQNTAFERQKEDLLGVVSEGEQRALKLREDTLATVKTIKEVMDTLVDRRTLAKVVPFAGEAASNEKDKELSTEQKHFLEQLQASRR